MCDQSPHSAKRQCPYEGAFYPYADVNTILIACLFLPASFVSAGLFAGFIEYFYAQGEDWQRVLRAALVISIVQTVATVAIAEKLRPLSPDLHVVSFFFWDYAMATSVATLAATAAAVFVLHFTFPTVLLISAAWAFIQGDLENHFDFRDVLHYSMLIAYGLGALFGVGAVWAWRRT